jgi:hypothetical protein
MTAHEAKHLQNKRRITQQMHTILPMLFVAAVRQVEDECVHPRGTPAKDTAMAFLNILCMWNTSAFCYIMLQAACREMNT